MLVAGGRRGAVAEDVLLELVAGGWEERTRMREGRQFHACTAHQGRLVVVGGADSGMQALKSVEFYDPLLDEWQAGPELPTGLKYGNAVSVAGTVWLVGGEADMQEYSDKVTSVHIHVFRMYA